MGKRIPRQGEIYRHFKNKLYQIVSLAEHSETGELMVVYQAMYGDFGHYVRPYEMFISEVDHEKYPDVEQKYRFQLVENGKDGQKHDIYKEAIFVGDIPVIGKKNSPKEEKKIISMTEVKQGPTLMDFLDARGHAAKLAILDDMRKDITDDMLNAMADATEIVLNGKSTEERYYELKDCLRTFEKYEKRR